MRLELTLRFLAKLRTWAAVFAGRVTLCRIALLLDFIAPDWCVFKSGGALLDGSLLEVEGGLGEVGGAAEVAPVVFVGAEGEDFLALPSESTIGVDDGEDPSSVSIGRRRGEMTWMPEKARTPGLYARMVSRHMRRAGIANGSAADIFVLKRCETSRLWPLSDCSRSSVG